jgi:hypothetical protein
MKKRFVVGFNFPREFWPHAQALFRDIGRSDLADEPKKLAGYVLKFDDDEDVQGFLAKHESHGLSGQPLWTRVDHEYTDHELLSAPLLSLGVNRAPKEEGGPRYGTQYDMSTACPTCGTGAVQISPLHIRPSDTPKNRAIYQTVDGERLVSENLAEMMRRELKGFDLRQAQGARTGRPLPWFQIISNYELPPMGPTTQGLLIEGQCPNCLRDGHFGTANEPLVIRYRDLDPGALPDIVRTWEHFGNSIMREPFERSHFAYPMLIMKPRVYELFRREKVRGISAEPLEIGDALEVGARPTPRTASTV